MWSEQNADVHIRRRVGRLAEGDRFHFILSVLQLVQALICAVALWHWAGWHSGESSNEALRKPVWLLLGFVTGLLDGIGQVISIPQAQFSPLAYESTSADHLCKEFGCFIPREGWFWSPLQAIAENRRLAPHIPAEGGSFFSCGQWRAFGYEE